MKRLVLLTFAFGLAQCRAQFAFQGNSYNFVPDCGPRGCGITYFVNYIDHQDHYEYGYYENKFFYRYTTFQTHGAGLGALEAARDCKRPQYLAELTYPDGAC